MKSTAYHFTDNYVYMKYLILLITISFVACSQEIQKESIEVNLSYKCKNILCISVKNNTKEKLYIPEIIDLVSGLKIIALNGYDSIDISDEAKIASFYCDIEKIGKTAREHYNITDFIIYLNQKERDSIASSIVNQNKNSDTLFLHHIKSWASRRLSEIIMVGPRKCHNTFFYISENLHYKKMVISYSYPYTYPKIKTGPMALSENMLKNNLALMDSLRFEYPKQIKGYKLYNSHISSDKLRIDLE